MNFITTPVDISEETFELARSIQEGPSPRETLAKVMENNRNLADFALDMTASTLTLQGILERAVDGGERDDGMDALDLALKLTFICGVARVWKECVLDAPSAPLGYDLMDVAGFAGIILSKRSLSRVLPFPDGGAYKFVMRVGESDVRFGRGVWFYYVVAQRPCGKDVCGLLLDHAHSGVVESIVEAFTKRKLCLEVDRGDAVCRLVRACVQHGRRRRRCGTYVHSRRETALAKLACHLVDDNAHAACIVRDLILHETLSRVDVDLVNTATLGLLMRAVQNRLPFLTWPRECLSRVPEEARRESEAWATVFEAAERALPPPEERVAHPEWAVRRRY